MAEARAAGPGQADTPACYGSGEVGFVDLTAWDLVLAADAPGGASAPASAPIWPRWPSSPTPGGRTCTNATAGSRTRAAPAELPCQARARLRPRPLGGGMAQPLGDPVAQPVGAQVAQPSVG